MLCNYPSWPLHAVVALVSVPLLYPVEFCGMDALCPLLAHYPESNSTPLPDPRCHVVLKEMELGGHSCMWVRLSVVLKEGLYVCFCRLNTTFIAYQELISLLLRGTCCCICSAPTTFFPHLLQRTRSDSRSFSSADGAAIIWVVSKACDWMQQV